MMCSDDRNKADRHALRGAARARRLAELQAVLLDCETMLATIDPDCPEARELSLRIDRARRDIDRLQGVSKSRPADADTQRKLFRELAHWAGNLPEALEPDRSSDEADGDDNLPPPLPKKR
ncbi:hypothetical protein [Sphingomicrobium sediminis]|uniref:Uncharacterized protein n=1 Tax=Sphingomicrobium sediminis TaxID=2950949 RepID=A0A9X2EL00_9SPHN|nr:hypothetical protein [Sphingomicrobium sediminis]MCM8557279.1 hypothetical protein [Sphingomicrobium sediminis]